MKTYHGERTEGGCEVTVDGEPLRIRSNLSGNATTAFDWGYVGTGQLSLALLSDFFGSDRKAKAMSEVFEEKVIAELPLNSWTMTEYALATALAPLVGVDGARADDDEADATAGAAFGDMPVESSDLLPTTLNAEDTAAAASMVSEGGHLVGLGDMPMAGSVKMKSPNGRAASEAGHVVNKAEDEAVNAANRTADEAVGAANRASDAAAVVKAAHRAAHPVDTPADEAMSTANRAADHNAYSANRAADKAADLARRSMDEAKQVVAKAMPIPVVQTLDTGENLQHTTVERHESLLHTPDLNGFKVMVVDDEADAIGLVKRIMEDCGATVQACTSGAECLTSVPKLKPDVVIMDIGLPDMDGDMLIGKLRALSHEQGGRTPAVALTSFAGFEDRRQAMPAGFDAHVAKPVEPGALMAVVSKLARHSRERAVSWPQEHGDSHGQ